MMKKILAITLPLVLALGLFTGCAESQKQNEDIYQPIDLADAVAHKSFASVYEMIGAEITVDMVEEDPDTGLAYVTYEGVKYELGMDFLSMAMVYNCQPAGSFDSAEKAYNQWWKLYIQRWNNLALAVPLYSNRYFDLYNAKIQNFTTTPFWSVADAIIAATVKHGEANSVILGSITELSGAFRASSWGKSTPGSSDLDIENLTSGYATVQTGPDGAMMWNMQALAEIPTATKNEDGTLTYTIKVRKDMKFSDGSAINAKNFLAPLLANSTEVAAAAGGSASAGLNLVGFQGFRGYNGTNDGQTIQNKEGKETNVTASKYFKGVKLIDNYTFSVTFEADYADYYYVQSYAAFSPVPMALYLGDNDILCNENGCYLTDTFYEKAEVNGAEAYTMAAVIKENLNWDSPLPYSGPYVVKNFDASTLTATLELNPNYPGDTARGKASIQTITYVKIISETQMDQFTTGKIDVLAGITGGDETKAALAVVAANPEKYVETHYDRAGYGFIGLRCDVGPAAFQSVRQAILHTINRLEFAEAFTGGYGSVVHGPYYEGMAAFKANENSLKDMLNQYNFSTDAAIAALEEGGWTYNSRGETFDPSEDDIRYKKLEGYELSKQNLQYASVDGKYKTVKIGGAYYMPLTFNWYGTQPNPVTDQLITAWQSNDNATKRIGMRITYTSCDFTTGLYGEYRHMEAAGWDGVSKCCGINYAANFNSTIYDFAYNWTIDPEMYDSHSNTFLMDEADFWENYQK